MKIRFMNDQHIQFIALKVGEVFKRGAVYMKTPISEVTGSKLPVNAVRLGDGEHAHFAQDTIVTRLDCELVVKETE